MNTESMKGSVIFMLLLQAVATYALCPCVKKDTPTSEEECRTTVSCIDADKKCQSDKLAMITYGISKETNCDIPNICVISMALNLIFEALSDVKNKKDATAEEVETKIRNKYPCLEKIDKNSCADEKHARECILSLLQGNHECVDPALKVCKAEGGLTKGEHIKIAASKAKMLVEGGSGKTEGESKAELESSYATQPFNYNAGIIVALLVF